MTIKIATQDSQYLYINTQLISTLRVVPLPTNPLTYGIDCVILPGKSIFIKADDKGSFETRQEAEQALQNFVETLPRLDLKLDKDFSALPAQTNPLLTDVLVLNRGTTAQKVTLDNLLAQVDNEIFIIVATLPATGVANKIYLVPHTAGGNQNDYEEYMWVNNKWENIGKFSIDLSDYDTKSEVDDKITAHNTNSEAHQDLRGDIGDLKLDIQTIEQSINGLENSKVDKNTNITAGTYTKITYDAKGLVTGGADLAVTDIPELPQSKITDLDVDLGNKINKNADIVGATKPKITYDSKGLVTAGADLVASDIPNLDAGKITTGTFADARIPTLAISKVTDLQSSLDNKVDKIAGKGLSTNDYTTTDKQSVEKIPTIEQDILDLESNHFNKTEINSILDDINLRIDTLEQEIEALEQEIGALKTTPE